MEKECKPEELYGKIGIDYETNKYTQEELAKKYGIPVQAVSFCTQKLGYRHTKVKDGKNVLCTSEEIKEFEKML